jgi:hypothetical protein
MSAVDLQKTCVSIENDRARNGAMLSSRTTATTGVLDPAAGANIGVASLWAGFMLTLHDSRHRAALRELHRYHELVQDSHSPCLTARVAVRDSAPASKAKHGSGLHLVMLLLAGFAVVHGIAEIRLESVHGILHPSSSGAPAVLAPGD